MSTPSDTPQAALPLTTLTPARWRMGRVVVALMLREMATTYGRSAGGYVWAVIQPVGMIVMLTLAFSLVIRAPALGTSFILFYATGYLPFDLYGQLSRKISRSLLFSRPLLAYPSVTWIDTIIARLLLNTLTLVAVFCIVMYGMLLYEDLWITPDLGLILLSLAGATMLGLGVGMMNCLLTGYLSAWGQLWDILNRPLFIASGIFFLFDDMPPVAQDILIWNPLVHVTGLMRAGFYPSYQASYVSLPFMFGTAFVLIALSLIFLRDGYRVVIQR